MTGFAIVLAMFAGFLLRHWLPLALSMWRRVPKGHHVVKRGGKVFVRRNPKPKEVASGE